MKKVLSVVACGFLAACSCDGNQWEEVDVVTVDDTTYVEPAPMTLEEAPMIVEAEPMMFRQEPVYASAPAPVYNSYPEPAPVPVQVPVYVQPAPCYQQPTCYQPQSCGCQPMPMQQAKPKVTTTKKIITTTTTVKEPCGKPVCEPVVTTHEEVLPEEVSYQEYNQVYNVPAEVNYQAPQMPTENIVNVTVESNPYRTDIVSMQAAGANADVAAKYQPEAYDVLASRAANRMLQDTSVVYDNGNTKTAYIKETRLLSSDLPYGSQRLRGVTKDIISGSRAYDIVNNASNADFIIETTADWYIVPNNPMPALQYKLAMFDRNGQKVNEWVEIIRQVED